jgi:hypothetical protein
MATLCPRCEDKLAQAVQQMQGPWRLHQLLALRNDSAPWHPNCYVAACDLPNWLKQHPELGVACYLGRTNETTIYFNVPAAVQHLNNGTTPKPGLAI